MTDSPVAVNRLQAFQVLLRVSSQISLDEKTISLNHTNDPIDLLVG
jgi:hypothetical protein